MKLNRDQIDRIEAQTGACPVPADDPDLERLRTYYGDHTFYLDNEGLYLWEPGGQDEIGRLTIRAVRVGKWEKNIDKGLVPQDPVPLDLSVVTGAEPRAVKR